MITNTLEWFKSSYSGADAPSCVEVALAPKSIHVRDSKHIDGDQLAFDRDRWTAFLTYATER
ncbi:DUF397 domain-containing protein [Streptomyces sp. NPDC059477]|uniref:DUF397 domain-containing protein n=1 Tax=Streptomyces sp. NPDC059477 TaxID=3346847 RepID=UPI0036D085E3